MGELDSLQVAKKHLKRSSKQLATREMPMTAAMGCHDTPVRMLK